MQEQPHHQQSPPTTYQSLNSAYKHTGITFKSNQIIYRISQIKGYPYLIVLDIVKQFHMNQFQILFYAHILNDEDNCFDVDPMMFESSMALGQFNKIYEKMEVNGRVQVQLCKKAHKEQEDEQQQYDNQVQSWNYPELKRLYTYLLVIGYSIKYYLNQSTKPYEQEIKHKYPQFFTKIFNLWVDKYSNKVLRTNPRKINQFYMQVFQSEQVSSLENNFDIDCQYRNYNQIVEELIKATSEGEETVGGGVGHLQEEKEYD